MLRNSSLRHYKPVEVSMARGDRGPPRGNLKNRHKRTNFSVIGQPLQNAKSVVLVGSEELLGGLLLAQILLKKL